MPGSSLSIFKSTIYNFHSWTWISKASAKAEDREMSGHYSNWRVDVMTENKQLNITAVAWQLLKLTFTLSPKWKSVICCKHNERWKKVDFSNASQCQLKPQTYICLWYTSHQNTYLPICSVCACFLLWTYTIQFNSPQQPSTRCFRNFQRTPSRDLQAALKTVNMNAHQSNIRKSRRSVKKKPQFSKKETPS